ncbi:hypothetical protein ACT4US_36365, partial [Bacillus sp. HC-Mk]
MYAIFHEIITFIFHALYHSMLSKKRFHIYEQTFSFMEIYTREIHGIGDFLCYHVDICCII